MTSTPEVSQIAAALKRFGRFLLVCHERADGDSLGCLLGLGLSLQSLGKSTIMYSPGGVPELYRFLPHQEGVISSLQNTARDEVDVVICVDCDGLARAGELSQWLDSRAGETSARSTQPGATTQDHRPLVIDVDHHEPDKAFGDIRLVVPQAPATAALVYQILTEMETPISRDVATCLLTGIYLDTGSFRYDNTNEEVLMLAARLTALGAQPAFVARGLYDAKSLPTLRLLGRALCSSTMTADGKIIFAQLTAQDFKYAGAQREDTEGIIDLLRAHREALVAALFIQLDGPTVKVSLRSKRNIDVSVVASHYGGGGHARASGFNLPGPLKKAVPAVIDEIQRLLG